MRAARVTRNGGLDGVLFIALTKQLMAVAGGLPIGTQQLATKHCPFISQISLSLGIPLVKTLPNILPSYLTSSRWKQMLENCILRQFNQMIQLMSAIMFTQLNMALDLEHSLFHTFASKILCYWCVGL